MKTKIKIFFTILALINLLSAGVALSQNYNDQPTQTAPANTMIGKVIKIDVEGGVINVESGTVTKEAFQDARLNADQLWGGLIKNGYIDSNGTIQAPFYNLDKFNDMNVPKKFYGKKKLIYTIFQNALADEGQMMVFYISLSSDLLQGTHHIASVEIEQGDPVTIQYDNSSPDKNTIIQLVDNKPE